ncbi:MAG: ribonuclease III [Candidatus Pelagibacter bacterium]|jgi:ribonuclease-3|nr:ribonuclease III [Candidatus Pelagibacter bacterium]|tara:strand:- start:69 stop:734 length:666 start_codon:yes stop_codon:yes gene_type:complete
MDKSLTHLQAKIKFKFKNIILLRKAITHKSYDQINNYEKLEFLGDRVLGLIISKKLLEMYPKEKEGILDKKLASLVNKNRCYEIGKLLQLEQYVLVGNANKKKIKIVNKIISDCIESLIGAIFYEKGFDFTEKFVLDKWQSLIDSSNITMIDSKTKLQEYSLKNYKNLPTYKLISSTGPKHKPIFKIGVRLKNFKFVVGIGNSKKNAEQAAAKLFLKNLNR